MAKEVATIPETRKKEQMLIYSVVISEWWSDGDECWLFIDGGSSFWVDSMGQWDDKKYYTTVQNVWEMFQNMKILCERKPFQWLGTNIAVDS